MCAGYAKEMRAWLCDDVAQFSANAVAHWSDAFSEARELSPAEQLEVCKTDCNNFLL